MPPSNTLSSNSDIIIGIDLGTTNSLVGVVDSGFPILLADADGRRILPSAVHFPKDEGGGMKDDGVIVGGAALRMQAISPERTVTSVKRFMGRRLDEISADDVRYPLGAGEHGMVTLKIGETAYSAPEVSAKILAQLKQTAETALDESISRAVITVPAYFNDGQRNATKQAGELAGLTVERIVNEPTAAALAYGLDKLDEQARVAVYDLGGGTFDISILELNQGVFQVISTTGDTELGGDDLDEAVADWIWGVLKDEGGRMKDEADASVQIRVLEAARKAKEELSSKDEVEIQLPFLEGAASFATTLTREAFEKLAAPILARTRPHCLKALADAQSSTSSPSLHPSSFLNEVILVGGSTRIPAVHQLVAEVFGQAPNISQNPDEAVALGATIQAGILSGALQNMVLLDVTPLSLGIETFGGLMNVIIPRNTTIPAKAGELFTNAVANQQSMLIRVLQGEREMAKDNWELGKFQIEFEPGAKGSARVGVQFAIDENGILKILARDTHTETDKVLEIQSAAVDVDDEEVEKMISESVDFAFDDMNERIWTEAKLKSEELLPAVDMALAKIGGELTDGEKSVVLDAAAEVKSALETEPHDVNRLKAANQELDNATEHLAALLVEAAMAKALEKQLES
ncbi:MAG: Hsp70 family protein [Verrucomicrobiota bacterium]